MNEATGGVKKSTLLSSPKDTSEENTEQSYGFTHDDYIKTHIPSPVPLKDILYSSTSDYPTSNALHDEPFPVGSWEDIDGPDIIEGSKKQAITNHESIEKFPPNEIDNCKINAYSHNYVDVHHNEGDKNAENLIVPNAEDIISARGCGRSHPGNLRFRDLVTQNKTAFDSNSSDEFRRSLALKIVNELKPGRFLKKEDVNQDLYKVMPFEKMITKVIFAMRDCKSHVKGCKRGLKTETGKINLLLRTKRRDNISTVKSE